MEGQDLGKERETQPRTPQKPGRRGGGARTERAFTGLLPLPGARVRRLPSPPGHCLGHAGLSTPRSRGLDQPVSSV